MTAYMNQLLSHFGDDIQFECFHPDVVLDDNNRPVKYAPIRMHGSIDKKHKMLQKQNELGYGIYFTINQTDNLNKRKDENIIAARAVWVEDDGDKHGVTDPESFPLPPSAIIQSSPGKYHYYWFTQTDDLDEWQRVINKMCKDYNGDPGGIKKVQVLRVPGYNNTKYDGDHLVTIEGGNFKHYSWEVILSHFPPVIAEPVSDKPAKIDTKERLDVQQAMVEIVTGESMYPNLCSLAFSFANKGISRKDTYSILRPIIEIADIEPNRRENSKAKLQELIDTAHEKVIREQGNLNFDLDSESKFTDLPWPPGEIGKLAQDINLSMVWPSKEIAIATAFHICSVIAGGCYHYQGNTVSRARTILAPPGRGKQKASDYFENLINRLPGAREMFITKPSFSAFNYQADLNTCRTRSLIATEAGLVNSSTAGDKANISAWILSVLSNKVNGAPISAVERSRGNAKNLTLEECKPVFSPVFVMLDESTPEVYLESAERTGHIENGSLARCELFFIAPEETYNESHYLHTQIPEYRVKMFNAFMQQFICADVQDGRDYTVNGKLIPADFSLIEGRIHELNRDTLKNRQYDEPLRRALAVRFAERVVTTTLLLAIMDSADTEADLPPVPVAQEHHLDYAIQYQTEIDRAVLAQSRGGHLDDALSRCCNLVTRALSKAQDKDSVDYRWVEKVLRTNQGAFQKYREKFPIYISTRDIRIKIMDELASSGIVSKKPGKKDQWINHCC